LCIPLWGVGRLSGAEAPLDVRPVVDDALSVRRGVGAIGSAVVAALIVAGVVPAGNPNKEQIAFTKAGRAQARADVVRRADVGSSWSGGFKKLKVSTTFTGCSYRSK
jgi:hypothetical protein